MSSTFYQTHGPHVKNSPFRNFIRGMRGDLEKSASEDIERQQNLGAVGPMNAEAMIN